MESVQEAQAQVTAISPQELISAWRDDPDMLVIDVRDEKDIAQTGIIPRAVPISLGTLGYKADETMPEMFWDKRLVEQRQKPIVVACLEGSMASLGAKQLQDMGYDDVRYLEGGTLGWKEAGYEVAVFAAD
jgi:rhodanese-related sulfurtransferase